MTDVQVITKEFFYAIKSDLSFIEHSSMQQAKSDFDLKFILKQIKGHNPVTTNNYGVINNYASTLQLYTIDGVELDLIKERDWTMKLARFGVGYGYSYTVASIEYTDSFGIKSTEEFGISVEEFVKAYKRFQQLNHYQGYNFAVISIENLILKKENEILKVKIDELSNERIRLQNRLSQIG